MKIHGSTPCDIALAAEENLTKMRVIFPTRNACIVRVVEPVGEGVWQMAMTFRLGILKHETYERNLINSKEKYERLSRKNQKYSHLSSWQSRDGFSRHGGAIVTTTGPILSIAGLTELPDEAVALGIAMSLNWIDKDSAVGIAKISRNNFFDSLIKI